MKKYLTEAILITSTNNLANITHWLFWYVKIIKFDHIIIIDNDSVPGIKKICEQYTNVTYYYMPGKISQSELYNKYVNESNAYWVMPVDDDEYLYISDKFNNSINEVIIYLYDYHKEFLKYSFTWAMMFSGELHENRDITKPVIEDFCYTYEGTDFFEHVVDIKTILFSDVKHMYYNNPYKTIPCKLEDIDIQCERLSFYPPEWNILYPQCEFNVMGTVHNPISKLYDTFLHSYNVTNGTVDIGCFTRRHVNINDDVYLCHYKYRSKTEWLYKVNKRNEFADSEAYYVSDSSQNDSIIKAYKYSKDFVLNTNPLKLWEKYI